MAFSLGEYQDIFLEEADEQLQELNQNLLELEKNPDDRDIINNIFRAAHSLKSSAAFVGLNDLSDLAHRMENLLQGLRDGTMAITPQIVDIIFKCLDAISSVIDTVAGGEEPTQNLKPIMDRIEAVASEGQAAPAPAAQAVQKEAAPRAVNVPATVLSAEEKAVIWKGIENGSVCTEVVVTIDPSAQMKWVKAQLIVANLERAGDVAAVIPGVEQMTADDSLAIFKIEFLGNIPANDIRKACDIDQVINIDLNPVKLASKGDNLVLEIGSQEMVMESVESLADADMDASTEADEDSDVHQELEHHTDQERKKAQALKTVKVSVDKLDQLLNNVGELVIANSGFYKIYEELRRTSADKSISNDFKNRMEQMSRIAKDLQTGIMKTRMVPIGQVFSRFNRLVRDLAKEFNKSIELVIKGEDTELDKKVIDVIGEPLMHLIRNSIDHGIEPEEERRRMGKSAMASVTLNAYQGGNQIFVEVSDDGRGLDENRIRAKVIEKGLATAEMLGTMDRTDIFNYIFIPGFSTANRVTDVSGRGVGMNVVKETVNELNGSVNIETEPGMGTRFVMTFPLTLAIIPAIMVRVQKEMYAIPLSDVIETIKISRSDITTIEGHEVINLRGEILSLLRLSDFIKLKTALSDEQKIPVVVVGFANRKIGLIVDFLEGKQEIVIKSLEQNYRTVEGFAGASILGDGSICLILDVASMINRTIADQEKMTMAAREMLKMHDEKSLPELNPRTEQIQEAPRREASPAQIKQDILIEEKTRPSSTVTEAPGIAATTEKSTDKAPALKTSEPVVLSVEQTAPAREEKKEPSEPAKPARPVSTEKEIVDKVQGTLGEFRDELRDKIRETVARRDIPEGIETVLNVNREDLSEFQMIANIGAANAAESLSRILGKRIDLSIPDVSLKPTEKIPSNLGEVDSVYIGVMLPIMGAIRGTLLFILHENSGFQLIDMLYGTRSIEEKQLSEDGQSALCEITNIVGSSVINVFAEKSGLAIQPSVPTIVHDYMQSIIDSILVLHNMSSDYAIIMDTAFFFENDEIIGNLLLLPETDSFKVMVEGLRTHVGSN